MPLVKPNRALLKAPYLRLVKSASEHGLEAQMREANDRTIERKRRWRANARRISTVLRKAGMTSRARVLSTRFDTWSAYRDIPGIGDVLGRQLRIMLNLYNEGEWVGTTGLPWDTEDDE